MSAILAMIRAGEVIGSCVAIRLSADHGNIGMFVVRSDYRGCGIGTQVWSLAVRHLQNRNKGLSAVSKLLPVYRDRAGFNQVADWSIRLFTMSLDRLQHLSTKPSVNRYQAQSVSLNSTSCRPNQSLRSSVRRPLGELCHNKLAISIRSFSKRSCHDLIQYDRLLHGYDRSVIVRTSCIEPDSCTRIAYSRNRIVGYATIKRNLQQAYQFGPIYSDRPAVARELIYSLIGQLGNLESIRLTGASIGLVCKVPNCNHSAVRLLQELGFQAQDYQLQRCYTDTVRPTATARIYAMQSTVFCSE